MKRHLAALALATATGIVALTASPASAFVAGTGQAVGTVNLASPGMPVATAPPAATTYTFTDVAITGLISHNGNTYNGLIDVTNVKGGSPSENTLSGSGTVNSPTDLASLKGTTAGKTICGTFYGTFQRVGSIVLVELNAMITIGSGNTAPTCPGSIPTKITVAAEFSPTAGNGVTQPITAANFTGAFATATL